MNLKEAKRLLESSGFVVEDPEGLSSEISKTIKKFSGTDVDPETISGLLGNIQTVTIKQKLEKAGKKYGFALTDFTPADPKDLKDSDYFRFENVQKGIQYIHTGNLDGYGSGFRISTQRNPLFSLSGDTTAINDSQVCISADSCLVLQDLAKDLHKFEQEIKKLYE